jgi:hypothetical protein
MTTTLLHEYSDPVLANDGRRYVARACAQEERRGKWIAWFAFVPTGGGAAVGTDRETTQSSLAAAIYWSRGITAVYLEGALERALRRTPWTDQDRGRARRKRRPSIVHSPSSTRAMAAG